MHLAGQADGGDRLGADAAAGERRADRLLTGAPPVIRILLRPGRLRRGERGVLRRRRSEQRAVLAEEQRASPAGADVDA
jgi:hypothetical protein